MRKWRKREFLLFWFHLTTTISFSCVILCTFSPSNGAAGRVQPLVCESDAQRHCLATVAMAMLLLQKGLQIEKGAAFLARGEFHVHVASPHHTQTHFCAPDLLPFVFFSMLICITPLL